MGQYFIPLCVCQYLDSLRQYVGENLKQLACAPSVEMQDVPADLLSLENTEEPNPDVRNNQNDVDRRYTINCKAFIYI